MIDQTLGSYKIVKRIGEGGMGAVYLAQHTMLGREVAIKVLLSEFSNQTNVVKRFFNEAKAATAVNHPGIIEIFDFGYHSDGSAYIVMELLHGETLAARVERLERLPVDSAVAIIGQVAAALRAAHAAGITHRDLKPDNVFLVPDELVDSGDRVKLLDFGIAKLAKDLRGDLDATRAGAVLGTPRYMAPEQCIGSTDVDHRADLYALGCLLFHLLCGRPPFLSLELGKISIEHLTQPPPRPSDLEPSIPGRIERALLRLLAKKPDDRFQSCGQLIAALEGKRIRKATPVPIMPVSVSPEEPTQVEGDAAAVAELGAPQSAGDDSASANPESESDAESTDKPAAKKRKTMVLGDADQSGENDRSGRDDQGTTTQAAAAATTAAAPSRSLVVAMIAGLAVVAAAAYLALS